MESIPPPRTGPSPPYTATSGVRPIGPPPSSIRSVLTPRRTMSGLSPVAALRVTAANHPLMRGTRHLEPSSFIKKFPPLRCLQRRGGNQSKWESPITVETANHKTGKRRVIVVRRLTPFVSTAYLLLVGQSGSVARPAVITEPPVILKELFLASLVAQEPLEHRERLQYLRHESDRE